MLCVVKHGVSPCFDANSFIGLEACTTHRAAVMSRVIGGVIGLLVATPIKAVRVDPKSTTDRRAAGRLNRNVRFQIKKWMMKIKD